MTHAELQRDRAPQQEAGGTSFFVTDQVNNVSRSFKNKHDNELKQKLIDFINKKFSKDDWHDFLNVYNIIEKQVYSLVDEKYKSFDRYAKQIFIDQLNDDAKHHLANNLFKVKFKHKRGDSFLINWEFNVKRLDCAGVILHRVKKGKGELLFVYYRDKNNKIRINFPMGKIDYNDNNNLKRTAVRELFEETNYAWPEGVRLELYQDTSYCFTVDQKNFKKNHKFYFFKNFEHEIDHEFKKDNEIEGSLWLQVDKLKKYFAKSDEKYDNTSGRINFINGSVTVRSSSLKNIKNLKTTFSQVYFSYSVENFFLRGSALRDCIFDPNCDTGHVSRDNSE